jgi:hypothetical protein
VYGFFFPLCWEGVRVALFVRSSSCRGWFWMRDGGDSTDEQSRCWDVESRFENYFTISRLSPCVVGFNI